MSQLTRFFLRSGNTPLTAVRHGSKSVYIAKPTFRLDYKPLPRQDGLVVDWRTDRKVIKDDFKPKNADFNVRFELLDENDIEPMTQFCTEYWNEQLNINVCLSMFLLFQLSFVCCLQI